MTDQAEPDAIDFTPVPSLRNRRGGWTAARQRIFIDTLLKTGLVGYSAKSVGMSAKSAYALRKRTGAESFAEAWDIALDMGLDQALDQAIILGTQGSTTPIFYRGLQVGERLTRDRRLLMRALSVLDRRLAARAKEGKPVSSPQSTRFV